MSKHIAYVRNEHGIYIAKCCASCAHKKCDSRMRICMKGEGFVHPSDCCDKWLMSPGFCNAGIGGGKVKKGDYIQGVLNKRMGEHLTLEEIRQQYEDEHQTIYTNL